MSLNINKRKLVTNEFNNLRTNLLSLKDKFLINVSEKSDNDSCDNGEEEEEEQTFSDSDEKVEEASSSHGEKKGLISSASEKETKIVCDGVASDSVTYITRTVNTEKPQANNVKADTNLDTCDGTVNKEHDQYDEDSSDEEDLRNTIGNVPINWYDEYPHIGYDWDAKPILKPKKGDTLDNLLAMLENPDFNRMVFDKQTGQNVRLSDSDLDLLKRVMHQKTPSAEYDPYPTWLDLYSHETEVMPVTGKPEHKRSFLPSKWERQEVTRLYWAIKKGLYRQPKKEKRFSFNYDIWNKEEDPMNPIRHIYNPLPAPKLRPPGHAESYNPPPEYLFTPEEKEKFEKQQELAEDERKGFKYEPKNYENIRNIPGYDKFIKERFERCLDLYLAPRRRVLRIQATSKDLLPVLPKPQDLRPFPSVKELVYKGHRSIIRTISVHPLGQFLASGSDDYTVKIWEISTGRCLRSFDMGGSVKCVCWNPNKKLFLLAVAVRNTLIFINPESYLMDKLVVQQTNSIFKEEPDQGDYIVPERVTTAVTWHKPTTEEWARGFRVVLTHFKDVKQVAWHRQGDYFATVIPEGDHRSVLMHQLSRWRSQVPFNKCKGRVQTASFHPKLPFLYVATQAHIRVYNLQKQCLTKKVRANSRWISSIAVHPGGEHFLIGSYDKRVIWFEMEYTSRPHVLRYHHQAVRSVAFHRKYPLFASTSDDGRTIVSHGMVYNDWVKDPLLVPLKELKGHDKFDDLWALDLVWHPYEPYLFTAGADGTICLWH